MKSVIASVAIAASVVAAPLGAVATAQESLSYVLVSHAPDSDSWWNTIKNGIALAGEQMGVNVEYRNPPTGDIADMARIIEQAAASGPNGIITTLADYDVLSGPIEEAVASGHRRHHHEHRHGRAGPSGGRSDVCRSAGIRCRLRCRSSCQGRWHRLVPLCEPRHPAADRSSSVASGFADGLGVELGESMIDSGTDPAEVKNKVMAYLSANPDTEAVLTLGPVSADPTIQALEENGMAGEIYFGTFDLGDEIVKAIKDGTIKWGIDQQPFLQAYLPVVILANYHRYGVLPGNNINSGPGFVTADGLELVEVHAGEFR